MALRFLLFLVFYGAVLAVHAQPSFAKPDRLEVLRKYNYANKLYRTAENFANSAAYTEKKELELNKHALQELGKLLPVLRQQNRFTDSLAFHIYFKMGVIQHFLDHLNEARISYQHAIDQRAKLPGIQDSFFFKPWLYKGMIYYNQDLIDSAASCYRNAELISAGYPVVLTESERLYNNLGILYHETGNYRQARNYFEKALAILPKSNPYYPELLITYKNNLASTLIRLEAYTSADEIYQTIGKTNQHKNEILYNLATIKLNTGYYQQAIRLFGQITYSPGKKVRAYAYTGLAFFKAGFNDSARVYFDRAIEDNHTNHQSGKNTPAGLALEFKADLLTSQKKYEEALSTYRAAAIQFYPGLPINDSLDKNTVFSGVFSYINLFNTLAATGDTYQQLYQRDKKKALLEAALKKYAAAFKLADYVEKTYDGDEARSFLNKIKYAVHDKPIAICLQLFELTQSQEYLEDAYHFDQQNKATILSLNVQENILRTQADFKSGLFAVESNLKSEITRLSLKASQANDNSQLDRINITIREYEIELSKVREKINELPGYRARRNAQAIPAVAMVQQMLGSKTAVLSYHLTSNELVIFCIAACEMNVYQQPINESFFRSIDLLKSSFNTGATEQRINETAIATQLYKTIISPVWNKIRSFPQLLIIPDDELNHLPFETLQDENGHYLVEKFSIEYQYSTALLRNGSTYPVANNAVLAMAPFSNRGDKLFAKLSYSRDEVVHLRGNILLDSAATKPNFILSINKYGIIHLATHTIVNDTLPAGSMIAFYPAPGKAPDENNLYLQEIYDLQLDATQLVVLSACETGTGQLSRGEGLMSLARAFTYAGCPNIIASLWKADDKSTAWIVQRFYSYLAKGERRSVALQKAKLDYLQDPGIEKRLKTPNYWAHLILTGIPEPEERSFAWTWVVAIAILSLSGLLFVIKKFGFKSRSAANEQDLI